MIEKTRSICEENQKPTGLIIITEKQRSGGEEKYKSLSRLKDCGQSEKKDTSHWHD